MNNGLRITFLPLFLLLLLSSDLHSAEIALVFSNGWAVRFDDNNFENYDYSGSPEYTRTHRSYTLTSFVGATKPENRGNSVYLTGLFKHTVKKYSHRGDLSVIEFTMTSREMADRRPHSYIFRQDRIQFETEEKPFQGMEEIAEALIYSLNREGMYKEIEIIQNREAPQEDKNTESLVTLISMSIDGIEQEREKPMSELFFDLFRGD